MTSRGRGGPSTGASPWPRSYKALASIHYKRKLQCQSIYFKKINENWKKKKGKAFETLLNFETILKPVFCRRKKNNKL